MQATVDEMRKRKEEEIGGNYVRFEDYEGENMIVFRIPDGSYEDCTVEREHKKNVYIDLMVDQCAWLENGDVVKIEVEEETQISLKRKLETVIWGDPDKGTDPLIADDDDYIALSNHEFREYTQGRATRNYHDFQWLSMPADSWMGDIFKE